MVDSVILVDTNDNIVGEEEKYACHSITRNYPNGRLHRAFSLFIFSEDKKLMLLQRRSEFKPTFPLLWTNAVCSHPRASAEESEGICGVKRATTRRAEFELGVELVESDLQSVGRILYSAASCDKYAEWELDYLIFACIKPSAVIAINQDEVKEIQWINMSDLCKIQHKTPWFAKLNDSGMLVSLWNQYIAGQGDFDMSIKKL